MNTWKQVESMLAEWTKAGMSAPDRCVNLANACIGWPYVFGARGEYCTPSNRRSYINTTASSQPAESAEIKKKCQVALGSSSSCTGCKWYPGGSTLMYDCRGFTYWVLLKAAGITISGGGATTQYNTNKNWSEKGKIENMPADKVCCVFRYDSSTGKYEHTLLYDGKGSYIHCSGEVKKCDASKYKATHYAIPNGLYNGGDKPVEKATVYAEKGSTVNMRKSASIVSALVKQVPIGSTINVTQRGSDWCAVEYGGKTGYMMTKFLVFEGEEKYTCTISKLTKDQADKLVAQYPNCVIAQG